MSYTNQGRPSKEQQLKCPKTLEADILEIRKILRLTTGKMLLLVSMAMDSMIRQVTIHPEVWFCDVLAGTNRKKWDILVMAVINPMGKLSLEI